MSYGGSAVRRRLPQLHKSAP